MSSPNPETPPFEAALEKLQLAVKRLESGELTLEQAIQTFEEGVKLGAVCSQHLAVAEQKVEILMKGDGAPEFQPFQPNSR